MKEIKQWITVNGQHIPIYEDESKADAINRSIAEYNEDVKERQIAKNKEQSDELNGKLTKEQKLEALRQQMDEAKGLIAKSKIKTEIDMLKADWQGTKEEWLEYKKKEHEKAVNESIARQKAELEAKRKKEDAAKKNLEHELKTQPKHKVDQYKIVQQTNPMNDDYHVGIRKPSDIKTWDEALKSAKDDDAFAWGDFSENDAKKALQSGKITIYSSYPIKQGVFVSTSKVQSEQYAGGKGNKVYSKVVPLEDVAWINGDEGQFAKLKK